MAKSKENLYLYGLSGSVGKQMVFRNTARGTILAKSPRHTGKRTEHQKEQGKKFLKAVAYAKQALADSSLSTHYKQLAAASPNKLSAYNIAVADYLRPPSYRSYRHYCLQRRCYRPENHNYHYR